MKALSTALSAALAAPVQQPAMLVEIAFATTRRWSSFADLTWNSQTWAKEDIQLEALQIGALELSGSLLLGNADDAAAALVLAEGVQDRAIRIWGYDAAATGATDVVWLADAVGAAATIGPAAVRIELRHRAEFMAAPRTFVNEAAFGQLLPAGTVLKINGRDFTVARRD